MLEAALIKECADPSLKPAIVEQFVQAVGSEDPLAITVKSGGRLILVPKPKTPEEAIAIVRENIGGSIVRVGLTQIPAGIGLKDASELKADLVDPCTNLRMGTTMFAKILRIVAKWYGNPTSAEVFPQLFDDAVHAWQTGKFEGESVFQAEDPGGAVVQKSVVEVNDAGDNSEADATLQRKDEASKPDEAGIRIDLTRIGGQK
ncbi:conjugal transfer protein TraH [Agrobacterium tumefaciens]|uniref:Conjugal transfer protein TraH n=1 Tax=Agrobacterium tumefaciens TaxID=358 RepID=A0AA44JAS9_AGRTU|nr:TraH family protein [Agrobacterium tumefaciens]NTB87962.1 conjugal transfer protein TraH [Agrobacterium tumefaciens]NTC20032.1 conjugal transfer protein TraH [Agrobacterium tumefaciens]NTC31209.1 conjugal transfer protein TraH [Agrobacterium tumefaciens]NTE57914.1 conjugal transfer protein TraH [Agrobacterium tumefaciens]NTE74618.1 conjugal transfer protein TraH [Agrobacterium tumefaciens]